MVPPDNGILFSAKKKLTRLLLLVLSPETQPDMGLKDEQRMLIGSGDPKEEEEEEEELVDPLRAQCKQLEKCVKAREQLELCDEHVSSG